MINLKQFFVGLSVVGSSFATFSAQAEEGNGQLQYPCTVQHVRRILDKVLPASEIPVQSYKEGSVSLVKKEFIEATGETEYNYTVKYVPKDAPADEYSTYKIDLTLTNSLSNGNKTICVFRKVVINPLAE